MDEDRYYNLGSHDKLFNQIDELTDALASRDAEIESLCQQLAIAENENIRLRNLQIIERIDSEKQVTLYEQALIASWPDGAIGDAFDFWNAARKLATTSDLDKFVLCEKEPVGYKHETATGMSCLNTFPPLGEGSGWVTTPLYRARKGDWHLGWTDAES